jgi:large subunit ribosomal protein L7/L12
MADIRSIVAQLVALTSNEAVELGEYLRTEYGIEFVESTTVLTDTKKEEVVEKTEFDVIIKSSGAQKLQIIKTYREMSGMSLIDAKNLIDTAPVKIKENVSKDSAYLFKTTLEALGAEIEVK